jgi:hypothetical protein
MSLPEEHKTAIISNGLHFVRSITEAYGAEKGMELWEQIASVLDPEVKGQLFFAMITGTYNDRIEIRGVSASHNAVSCIKEIRQWTGLGLKESKDIVDRLRTPLVEFNEKRRPEYLKVNHEDYSRAVSGLRAVGFVV